MLSVLSDQSVVLCETLCDVSGMSDTWHIIQIRGYDLPVFNMVYIHVIC